MSTTITIETPEITCADCGARAQAPAVVVVAQTTPGYGPGAWFDASDGGKWRVVPASQPHGWMSVGIQGVRCPKCIADGAVVAQATAAARVPPSPPPAPAAPARPQPQPQPARPEPLPPSAVRHGMSSVKDVGPLPSAPIRAGSVVSSIPIPPQRNPLVQQPVAAPTAMPARAVAVTRTAGVVRAQAQPIVMAPAPAPVVVPNTTIVRQEGQPVPHLPTPAAE